MAKSWRSARIPAREPHTSYFAEIWRVGGIIAPVEWKWRVVRVRWGWMETTVFRGTEATHREARARAMGVRDHKARR